MAIGLRGEPVPQVIARGAAVSRNVLRSNLSTVRSRSSSRSHSRNVRVCIGSRRQAGVESHVNDDGITRFDSQPGGCLRTVEIGGGHKFIGSQPGNTARARDIEQRASGEDAVSHGGHRISPQALGSEYVVDGAIVVGRTVEVEMPERVDVGSPPVDVQRDLVDDRIRHGGF
ncbi:hypothetical protein MKW15_08030 [Gordonia sp. ABSL49_1]|nr:hypothetical protein [Gordonia sp. ABSL49_1]MCH5642576.1 hypothetical protein [Gordonia sp. ABSL49_1]